MSEIMCRFAGGASGACEGAAAKFVRPAHSGRLVPLCGPCLASFEGAAGRLQGSESLPGEGKYASVGLEEGREEWGRQPPK